MNELRKHKIMNKAYEMVFTALRKNDTKFLTGNVYKNPNEMFGEVVRIGKEWKERMTKKTISNMEVEKGFISTKINNHSGTFEELARLVKDYELLKKEIEELKKWKGEL